MSEEIVDKILIGIGGGILGVLLTFIANIYLKNKAFKEEFYKKIIEKRITAYEFLENYLFLLSGKYNLNGEKVGAFLASYEKFIHLHDETIKILLYRSWYSKELLSEIKKLATILAQIKSEVSQSNFIPIEIPQKYGSIIKDLTNNIGFISYGDFYKLDKVKSFLKSKEAYKIRNKKLNRLLND